VFTAIWLLIIGLGIIGLGVPPSGEEVGRILWLLLATIFYGGIWLALALMFSTVFRQPVTAALASIAVWLFFTVFWEILAGVLAQTNWQLTLSRLSPNTLYGEIMVALLQPTVRSLGLIFLVQLQGAVLSTPLPLQQSLLLIWPQLTGLIAATILLFAIGYVLFQRQEIRA